jgi:hypothetical protein
MKTNKGSFTQRACQRQARWACRAGRFRDAGLTQFLFSLCAGWAILIGSDHLLETDVNDWKQTAATGSNRWFFRRFLRRRRIAQAKDNGEKQTPIGRLAFPGNAVRHTREGVVECVCRAGVCLEGAQEVQ